MRPRSKRPAVPDIAAVPILGADGRTASGDSFANQQSGDHRPDHVDGSAYQAQNTHSVAGEGQISEPLEPASGRLRHPISGTGTAQSP